MIDDDLQKRGLLGKFDRISWPGAAKNLENVKEATNISLRLHDPDELIIYEHEDCGAYQEDNSQDTHRQSAQNLINKLKEIKPNIKVTILMTTFEGIKEL